MSQPNPQGEYETAVEEVLLRHKERIKEAIKKELEKFIEAISEIIDKS